MPNISSFFENRKNGIQILCVKNAENDRKVEVQSSPKLDRYILLNLTVN